MKSDLQLSIISPIYNVEPFLEKCIRSLENQDIPKDSYEIICVNDGSPDNCKQIILNLQKEFNNIILIDQENQGVSMARNNAMAVAKGDYLMFVDPDDFIASNCLSSKLKILKKFNLDVGYGDYIKLDKNGKTIYTSDLFNSLDKPLTGIDFFNSFFKGKSYLKLPDRSTGIFFNRDFIISNKLFYVKDVPFLEDGELLYRIYTLAREVMFLETSFLHITSRSDSAVSSGVIYTNKAIEGFLKAVRNLKGFQNQFYKNSKEYIFLNQAIAKYLFLYLYTTNKNWFNRYFKIKSFIKKEFPKIDERGCSFFYAKYVKYYNHSLLCFYLQYNYYLLKKSLNNKLSSK